MNTPLSKHTTGLILIDVQEKLFPAIHEKEKLLDMLKLLCKGVSLFSLPVIITEQYPQGLGSTINELQEVTQKLSNNCAVFAKTTFSCVQDQEIYNAIENYKCTHWILAGIECHICILETAYDLLRKNYHVIVPEDATGSRKAFNLKRGLQEMQAAQVRVTSIETILFELAQDAKAPEFKELIKLVR